MVSCLKYYTVKGRKGLWRGLEEKKSLQWVPLFSIIIRPLPGVHNILGAPGPADIDIEPAVYIATVLFVLLPAFSKNCFHAFADRFGLQKATHCTCKETIFLLKTTMPWFSISWDLVRSNISISRFSSRPCIEGTCVFLISKIGVMNYILNFISSLSKLGFCTRVYCHLRFTATVCTLYWSSEVLFCVYETSLYVHVESGLFDQFRNVLCRFWKEQRFLRQYLEIQIWPLTDSIKLSHCNIRIFCARLCSSLSIKRWTLCNSFWRLCMLFDDSLWTFSRRLWYWTFCTLADGCDWIRLNWSPSASSSTGRHVLSQTFLRNNFMDCCGTFQTFVFLVLTT